MSYSWKSPSFTVKNQWKRLESSLRRMRFDRCPAIPHDLEEFIAHLADIARDNANYAADKLAINTIDKMVNERIGRQPTTAFDSMWFGEGRVGVLGIKSIWARGWTPEKEHPIAHWPDAQELKEEGDERHTSNFGRCMPMLRSPGNETVNWKQLPELKQYPFDQVMHVPRKCAMVNPKMPGFTLELDEDGIPYDDDDMPGGSTALAYHLEGSDENMENTTPFKIWQTQVFHQYYAAQIHGYNAVVVHDSNFEFPVKEKDHTEKAAGCTENTKEAKAEKPKKQTFTFNPKAATFVSVTTPPASDGRSSPSEEHFENPIKSPKDVCTIIDHINTVAASLRRHSDAHKYTASNGTAATPALTVGLTAPEPDELDSRNARTIRDFAFEAGNGKTHRGSIFGAIGSERRSSDSIADDDSTTDDGESEIDDGGVSLDAGRFGALVRRYESPEISPKTIPKSYLYADEEPATLADLVAASEPDPL